MNKVYLDTNVIMDIVDTRFNTPNLENMVFKNYVFVVSDLVIYELRKQNVKYLEIFKILD